jgi:hypothetical protein
MRKLITTILAFFYLFSATGINVHMHYCMDKLTGWGVANSDSAVCAFCGMEKTEKDGGCCKDESRLVKSTGDQQVTEASIQLMQAASEALPALIIEFSTINYTSISRDNSYVHTPPRSAGVAVYIRNCVFLI